MKYLRSIFGAALLFILVEAIRAAESPELPPAAESLFHPPAIILPALSPDGRHLVYGTVDDKRTLVVLLDLATGAAEQLVRAQKLHALFWKGNTSVVYSDSTAMAVCVVDITTRKSVNLTNSKQRGLEAFAVATHALATSPSDIVVDNFTGNSSVRLNIHTGAHETLFKGTQQSLRGIRTTDYLADANGQIRARMYLSPSHTELQVRENNDEAFTTIKRWPATSPAWKPLIFSEDGNLLWVISEEDSDGGALHAYDLRQKKLGPSVRSNLGHQMGGAVLSGNGRILAGIYYYKDHIHNSWLEEGRAKLQAKLESSFPNKDVSVLSSSHDEAVHVVQVNSDREARAWYILDLRKPSLTLLAKEAPPLPAERMPRCRVVDIPASDGFILHGYLTSPVDAQGPLPLVLLPNDAPFNSRYIGGYDAESLFWATRGYSVLRLNYRGANGYGQAYQRAGSGELDGRMIDDINDAARWLGEQRLASKGQILLCGRGLAGGLAIVAAAEHPEFYCGVVSIAGRLDWSKELEAQRSASMPTGRIFNAKRLKTRAPFVVASTLSVPLLPLSVFQLRDWDVPLKDAFGKNHKNLAKAKPYEGDAGAFNAEAYNIYYVKQIEPFFTACLKNVQRTHP